MYSRVMHQIENVAVEIGPGEPVVGGVTDWFKWSERRDR